MIRVVGPPRVFGERIYERDIFKIFYKFELIWTIFIGGIALWGTTISAPVYTNDKHKSACNAYKKYAK